jgi:hypothetical protein
MLPIKEPLYDPTLPDAPLRLLLKIVLLADEESEPGGRTETRPRSWREYLDLFALSRSRYFSHLRILKAAGYLETEESFHGLILRPIPRIRNLGATTTLKDSYSINEENLLKSSRSEIPKNGNELAKFEILKAAGIGDPLRRQLVEDPDVETAWISAHCDYAKLSGDPVRILAHRLKVRDEVDVETFDKLRQISEDVADFWK